MSKMQEEIKIKEEDKMNKYKKIVEWRDNKTGLRQNFSFISSISPLNEQDRYNPKILFREWLLGFSLILLIPFAIIMVLFQYHREIYWVKL